MVSGRSLPGFLDIVFKDTGIGIDPEKSLRIFVKFSFPRTIADAEFTFRRCFDKIVSITK
jgi:hypothetical protein